MGAKTRSAGRHFGVAAMLAGTARSYVPDTAPHRLYLRHSSRTIPPLFSDEDPCARTTVDT